MSHNQKEIEKLISEIECPKEFSCYKRGYKDVCKAKDIIMESFLECLEDNSEECLFFLSYGLSYFCRSLLRVYIAKELNK